MHEGPMFVGEGVAVLFIDHYFGVIYVYNTEIEYNILREGR